MITLLRFGTRSPPAVDPKQTTVPAALDEIWNSNSTKQLTGFIRLRTVVPNGWLVLLFNDLFLAVGRLQMSLGRSGCTLAVQIVLKLLLE